MKAADKLILHQILVSDLLAAISLSTRLAVVKVKGHSTSGEIQAEGNHLAAMAAEWAAQEGSTSLYCSIAPVNSMYMFSDNYSVTGNTS